MALIVAMLATLLLATLGTSLVLLGNTEMALAAHERAVTGTAHAARGALALAISDLRARPSWAGAFAAGTAPPLCAAPGPFVDASLSPSAPWGGPPLDLRAWTSRVQSDSDALVPPGAAAPVWRLFEYGPITRLFPAGVSAQPFYLAVWVADGGGTLLLRAAALGPGTAQSALEAAIGRLPDSTGARVIWVRPAE